MIKLNNFGDNKNTKFTTFVYGKPLSGKSTFANTFPKPLIVSTDGNAVQFPKTPSVNINNANELFELVSELLTKEQPYETIVFDVVDKLVTDIEDYVAKTNNVSHISAMGYGKGWSEAMTLVEGVFSKLILTNKYNIVFISHEKTQEDVVVNGEIIKTFYKSSLREKVETKLIGMSQIIGRLYIKENVRIFEMEADNSLGGNRFGSTEKAIIANYKELIKLIK